MSHALNELEEEARLRLGILAEMGAETALTEGWQAPGTPERLLPYSERVEVKAGDVHPMRDEYMEHVAWLEESAECVVYQATVEHSIMGDLLDLFVVTGERENWEAEREALRRGTARAWVAALDLPTASDWFEVDFEVIDGALVRVG
ncbi:MAG: hypothetical protein IKS49_02005 [Actinomycetaceae bacterium]|nr:hypothetical protein [Actinomycetaceae bacterium]